jgi:hypothetical protein
MVKTRSLAVAVAVVLLFSGALLLTWSCAAEHPGKTVPESSSKTEHPGTPAPKSTTEHPGAPAPKGAAEHPGAPMITSDFVKKSIMSHVDAEAKAHHGVFMIRDDKLNKTWELKFDKIHDPVRMFEKDGKTIYFACSDFKSVDGKDVLDIDFWMVPEGNVLVVTDTKIHKVNGQARYTYEGTTLKEIK